MRCPDCSKFVSIEEAEPEVDVLRIDSDGTISGAVRIVNTCMECGTELTEATFDVDETVTIEEEHAEHELDVEIVNTERTSRTQGKGRSTRTFYGFELEYTVTCSCGHVKETGTISDEIQASHMDSLTY